MVSTFKTTNRLYSGVHCFLLTLILAVKGSIKLESHRVYDTVVMAHTPPNTNHGEVGG